jgi:Flp pilus assembly protein TadG
MKHFRKFIRDRTGEGYVDVAIAVLTLFTLMASLMALFPVFTAQQALNNTARQLARMAEVTGSAQDAEEAVGGLSVLPPDSIDWDTDWYDTSLRTIQLKTPFTVTVMKQVSIAIFRPALADPIAIHVTISAAVHGVSEVYWK